MPQGIQVFNADGSLQFDSSHRIVRFGGQVTTGTSSGSTTVAAASTGTLLVLMTVLGIGVSPVVTQSGTTVTWTFSSTYSTGMRTSCILTFMVY